jgi:hypothetical protein
VYFIGEPVFTVKECPALTQRELVRFSTKSSGIGTNVTFTCFKGSHPGGGNWNVQCLEDMTWSGRPLTCIGRPNYFVIDASFTERICTTYWEFLRIRHTNYLLNERWFAYSALNQPKLIITYSNGKYPLRFLE